MDGRTWAERFDFDVTRFMTAKKAVPAFIALFTWPTGQGRSTNLTGGTSIKLRKILIIII